MDILYTVNKQFLPIMLTSMYSLGINSNLNDIKLHVVTSDFDKEDFDKLKFHANNFDNIRLFIYKLEDFPIEMFNIPDWKGSQIANARLFYPRIIKEEHSDASTLLYLDSDTIVIDDLNPITKYSNETLSLCLDDSVPNKYYKNRFDLDKYYNSGVIYYNLDKFNKLGIEDRIRDFNSTNTRYLEYPDQDIINIIFKDYISTLDPRYNLSSFSFFYDDLLGYLFFNKLKRQMSYSFIKEEIDNKAILHSYGLSGIKPWHNNMVNPFNNYFDSFMNLVDEDSTKEDLEGFKAYLANNQQVMKLAHICNTYAPTRVKQLTKNIINKVNKKES